MCKNNLPVCTETGYSKLHISNQRLVLVLLITFTDIVTCNGNVFGKCHLTRQINDKTSEFYADVTACDGDVVGKCDITCYIKDQISEYYVDCSDRNLTDVPNNLPTNTTCLNMVGNKISEINGKSWQRYKLLKTLSLARNRIDRVRTGDFAGLSLLEMLDLSLNQIRYFNIGRDAFRPLEKLIYLDLKQGLSNISINETYPVALNNLHHLHTLVIDGLGTQALPHMPNLMELYMSGEYGRCNIPHINESFFENTLGVQNLFLSKCLIRKIEFNTFKSLRNITSLDLSWNINLGIESVPNITSGLNGSKTLKRLNFNTLYDHSQFDFCSSLNIDDVRYLSNTSIELATVENNNLVRMDIASVIQWPKSIKYLSVQHNMFLYGNYTPYLILSGVLNNIVYLDVSHMAASNRPISTPRYSASVKTKQEEKLQPITYETCQPEITVSSYHSLCMSMFTRNQFPDYFQVIEDKLKQHDIGTDSIIIDTPEIHSPSKLEYLDISDNLPVLIERMFEIFPKIPKLKVLNVSRNYLGYPLYDGDSVIGHLKNIRTLDLSDNKIIYLMPNIFNNLTKLENLHLSQNKISNITFELSHLKNLSYLDLEGNSLESINLAARDAFDKLPNIKINIARNNLKCVCENTEFFLWVEKHKDKFAKIEETYCTFKNSTSVSLATLHYDQFRLECSSYLTLILIASLSVLFFIIILISALVYRFRWNLRYLYYMTKMKLFADYQRMNDTEYEKDVFVSYADEDRGFVIQQVKCELEEKGEISLLIHDRDFRAGEYVVDNILRAITSTRRTLIILTKDFVRSKWCMYELNMARMEAADTGRNVLCVILKEDIPLKHLPIEIIDVLQKKTYLEYPTIEDNLQGFWKRLRATLKNKM
ncbi:toll-like receptor 4 [Mercenaria mercenaria]|uniref:toll-like receptor 4 n=1 Tax=Mercenaria mercenaria TaxID=6596 RepID=UPI00234E91CB|nr:toll-like receptor 4 [Mercenaria mercenaria]